MDRHTRMGSFYPSQRGEGVLYVQSLWRTIHVLKITIVRSKNGFFEPGKSMGVSRSIYSCTMQSFLQFLLLSLGHAFAIATMVCWQEKGFD